MSILINFRIWLSVLVVFRCLSGVSCRVRADDCQMSLVIVIVGLCIVIGRMSVVECWLMIVGCRLLLLLLVSALLSGVCGLSVVCWLMIVGCRLLLFVPAWLSGVGCRVWTNDCRMSLVVVCPCVVVGCRLSRADWWLSDVACYCYCWSLHCYRAYVGWRVLTDDCWMSLVVVIVGLCIVIGCMWVVGRVLTDDCWMSLVVVCPSMVVGYWLSSVD
jgi:hypothetical protein